MRHAKTELDAIAGGFADLGHVEPLTRLQQVVLVSAARYYVAASEPCSMSYLERKLELSRATVRGHIAALVRKGFGEAPCMEKVKEQNLR